MDGTVSGTHFDTAVGENMYDLATDLFPICRSITGDGVRATLKTLQAYIPLEIREVASGTPVFDWTVPKEWNIRDAYIKNDKGRKVVDFTKNNLHVLNYSTPINRQMSLEELRPHLFTIPEHPDWIPYKTSYYNENWGFCLSHNQLQEMLESPESTYEVVIDSTLESGHLTYGEYFLPGESADEILMTCHVCHPSLANDNLSGIALVTFLARHLATVDRRYSYRFLFMPGTIGAITWLALNEKKAQHIKHGLVVACVGDPGKLTYKRSRIGSAVIDRAVAHILEKSGVPYEMRDFVPYGYDERQFCSPGFNLPVGSLTRTPHGEYPQYHTSADNLDLVTPDALAQSYAIYLKIIEVLGKNDVYVNQNPKCEPQLGKRGLYAVFGGGRDPQATQMAMLWVLNLSDGRSSLLDIAERSGVDFETLSNVAAILEQHNLLRKKQLNQKNRSSNR